MPETSTEAMRRQHDENREAVNLHRRMQHFIEKWQPKDPHEASHFNAEVNMLIREVYYDMSKPVNHALEVVMRAAPPSPIFIKADGKIAGS